MSLFDHRDGYYDEHGTWQRTKFCFVDCGDRCTCKPPNGHYQKPGTKKPTPAHYENADHIDL